MLDFSRVQNYYIACGYTDMRKQIDGLAALVQTQFGQEMDETSLYLFCGRRADRIKALYWDGTGYILLYKRLTEKRFQWPRSEKDLKKLTLQEFRWLMEGLSITQTKAFVPGAGRPTETGNGPPVILPNARNAPGSTGAVTAPALPSAGWRWLK